MPKIHTRTTQYYLLSEIADEVASKTGEPYSRIVYCVKKEFYASNGWWPDYEMFEVEFAFEGEIDAAVYNELESLLRQCSTILMDV